MPTALMFALAASYGLAHLFQKTNHTNNTTNIIRVLFISILTLMLIDGLISFGTSKSYLRDGGYWIKDQYVTGEKLITNHHVVRHYAGIRLTAADRKVIELFDRQTASGHVNEKLLKTADYVAIRVKHLSPNTLSAVQRMLADYTLAEFSTSDRERLLVYKKPVYPAN